MPKKVSPKKLGQEVDDLPEDDVDKLESCVPGSSGGSYSGPRRKVQQSDLELLLRDEIGTSIGLCQQQTIKIIGPVFKKFNDELTAAGLKNGMPDLQRQVILEIAKRFAY